MGHYKSSSRGCYWSKPEPLIPTTSLVALAVLQYMTSLGFLIDEDTPNRLVFITPGWRKMKGSYLKGLFHKKNEFEDMPFKVTVTMLGTPSRTELNMTLKAGGNLHFDKQEHADAELEAWIEGCNDVLVEYMNDAKQNGGVGLLR